MEEKVTISAQYYYNLLKKETKLDDLIKYLEAKVKEPPSYNLLYDGITQAYREILERIKDV